MPFDWTEGQAQAWSAIVQAVTAVLILCVTVFLAALTVYQHYRSGRGDRERLSEERVASAGLMAMRPPVVDVIVADVAITFVVTNPTTQVALDVFLEYRVNDKLEGVPFGDLLPGGEQRRTIDGGQFLEHPVEDGDPHWALEELSFELVSTWLRGQTVIQTWIWRPADADDEEGLGFIQDVATIDPHVKGVKPRKLV